MYECIEKVKDPSNHKIVNEETNMLYLVSVNDDASTEEVEMPITKFTTQLKCCVNVILSEDKRGKVKISINSNCFTRRKFMVILMLKSWLIRKQELSIKFFINIKV